MTTSSFDDPYRRPVYSWRDRCRRAIWNYISLLLFRPAPRPLHAWRALLLRMFGAKLGADCKFYPKARIWAPWNLICEDSVVVADDAIIYNPAPVHLGSHCIVSEMAYLCGAGHDYDDPAFPTVTLPISLGAYSWICARASVQMGVTVGDGAVLGLASVATKDLESWSINAGVPARKIKARRKFI